MPRNGLLALIAVACLLATTPGVRAQESQQSIRGTEAPAETTAMGEDGKPTAPPKEATTEPDSGTVTKKTDGASSMWPLLLMLGAFVLLWLWMGRGKNKEAKKRNEMLSALKKGDKITTIGGVIGTVIEMRDDEILVKVDDSANVRMKFARWAIRGVGETAKAENPQQADKDNK